MSSLCRGRSHLSEQPLDDLVRPVVRGQQQVTKHRDTQVTLGLGALAADVGFVQHLDDRLVLLVKPSLRDLAPGTAAARARSWPAAPRPRSGPTAPRSATRRTARMRSRSAGGSGTRSRKMRSWRLSGRSLSLKLGARADRGAHLLDVRVDVSVTHRPAPLTRDGDRPRRNAVRRCDTRRSAASRRPRRRAVAIRSHRPRTPLDVGRNLRSNSSWRRATVPTIESSVIDCRPRSRWLTPPERGHHLLERQHRRHVVGLEAQPRDDPRQGETAALAREIGLGVLLG